MFRNLKCKNTILCELSFIIIPLLLIVAGFVALAVIPNDEIGSIVLIVCFILGGVSLVLNSRHIFTIDFTLTSLRNWQKDRLSFETDINGATVSEVEKAITERASNWGIKQENQNGAVLTLYKKTKTLNDITKVIHQILVVYSMPTLTFDDYKAKLDELKKQGANFNKGNDEEDTTIAVLFLCDRAEQTVLNSVRDDCDFIDDEKGVVLPIIYDALTRQYYLNAYYEYNFIVKSTKNYLLDSIKKIVFGGGFPIENNDRFDYSNEISVWQDKTLGELIDDIKANDIKEKEFVKNTAEQLSDGQFLFREDELYVKYNDKLALFMAFPDEDKPQKMLLWEPDSWEYPKKTEISKKDQEILKQMATDYFKSQNKIAVFDIKE
ncbi:MAG: hypothetical protein IKJ50_05400 [Clostridia bacterium]|nr:hypothetical protein [Clostridia bacterium]